MLLLKGTEKRSWTPDEITDRIETLVSEDKLEGEFTASVSFFEEKKNTFNSAVATRNKEQEKVISEARNIARKTWNTVTASKELKGEKFTEAQFKDFETSVTIPNKVIEAGGNMHKVTEFDEFKHNMYNDLETQLYLFKLFKFRGQEMDIMKSGITSDIEDEVLSGMSKRTKVIKKAVKKPVTQKKKNVTKLRFS